MRLILNKLGFFKLIPISLIVLMVLFACSDGGETVTPAAQPTAAPASQAQPTTAPATQAPPTAAPAAQAQPTAAPTAPPPAATEPPVSEPIQVVTTTNIVADWIQIVGGDRANVLSLLPAGADPHAYQPGAKDVAAIADADLVFAIGLGLEESWLHELLENAARDEDSIVEVAEVIEPIEFGETHAEEVEILEEISHVVHEVEEGEISAEEGLEEIEEAIEAFEAREEEEEDEDHHGEDEEDEDEDEDHEEGEEDEEDHGEEGEMHLPEMVMELIAQVRAGQLDAEEAIEEIEHLTEEGEDEHEGHGHGQYDPHFWFDPIRVKVVVNDIAARLSVLDPDGRDMYAANAAAYGAQLDELHAWTQEQVDEIPEENKLLVTSHESLGYFAVVYDFEVVGVILSTTTEVEPSPADMAELAHEIEEAGISVIFGETTVSERLAEAIAAESGAEVIRLYSGSLGAEGSGAETYLDMVRLNVERIVDALR